MNQPLIHIQNLSFGYSKADSPLLEINNLEIRQHEHLFIEGPSGSGKTTLLNLLSGVQDFNEGKINLLNQDFGTLSAKEKDSLRADHMGVIFQMFNLIPYLSIVENILLPCQFSKRKREKFGNDAQDMKAEAFRLAQALGLDDFDIQKTQTSDLSVGQQQRVAAARALMGKPELIIADEPTSALDEKNTNLFMQLLLNECEKNKSSLVFVSHDLALKSYFNNHYTINAHKA